MTRGSILTRHLLVIASLFFTGAFNPAYSTVPADPIFIGAQMIMVDFSVVSEDRTLLRQIPPDQMSHRLTAYLAARTKDEGLDIVVTDNHGASLPAGVYQDNVIWIFVRADLATITAYDGSPLLTGVASVLISRSTESYTEEHLSGEPMTFFSARNERDELTNQIYQSSIDQLEKSVIEPILLLKK
jgi:hypothetical protein